MNTYRRITARGVTLPELVTVMAVTFIIVLTVGTLVCAGQKQWLTTYTYANSSIESDAVLTMVKYGIIGRQSNKNDYMVYKLVNGNYTRALPPTGDPTALVTGDAVEFRYWDTGFDGTMLDPTKTATAYAFYYLDGHDLKLDQGPYSSVTHIGAVNNGHRVTGNNVMTSVLSSRVTSLQFSHDTKNAAGDGDGSVRMEVTFTDTATKDTLSIKSTTLMRNVWP